MAAETKVGSERSARQTNFRTRKGKASTRLETAIACCCLPLMLMRVRSKCQRHACITARAYTYTHMEADTDRHAHQADAAREMKCGSCGCTRRIHRSGIQSAGEAQDTGRAREESRREEIALKRAALTGKRGREREREGKGILLPKIHFASRKGKLKMVKCRSLRFQISLTIAQVRQGIEAAG